LQYLRPAPVTGIQSALLIVINRSQGQKWYWDCLPVRQRALDQFNGKAGVGDLDYRDVGEQILRVSDEQPIRIVYRFFEPRMRSFSYLA
jgi:hypothetical protein